MIIQEGKGEKKKGSRESSAELPEKKKILKKNGKGKRAATVLCKQGGEGSGTPLQSRSVGKKKKTTKKKGEAAELFLCRPPGKGGEP